MNLKTLYNFYSKHPEASWVMVPENAQQLFAFIKSHPIKRILDLGTGIGLSAAVCAHALKDKGEVEGRVDSVEQFDKCVDLANKLMPEEFKSFVTIHKANAEIWNTDKIPYHNFSIFDKLPEGEYDLIINDGPGPFEKEGSLIDLPNGTIHKLLLEDKIKPGTFILFDGRITALRSLDNYFGSNFYIHLPDNTRSDFNMLERKDCPVKFEDCLFKNMQDANYFGGVK